MTFEPHSEGREGVCHSTKRAHSMIGKGGLTLTGFGDWGRVKSGPGRVTWGTVTGKGDQNNKLGPDLLC